jgi:hypothetical protein
MNDEGKIEHEVSLHLLELGVKLYCRSTGDLVLHFPYPKVLYKENLTIKTSFIQNFFTLQLQSYGRRRILKTV